MADLIGAMSLADGYSMDWGAVNKFDSAVAEESLDGYPIVDIKVDTIKPIKATHSQITHEAEAVISVKLASVDPSGNARGITEEGLALAESALEDLEDLFYKASSIIAFPNGVIAITPADEGAKLELINDDARPVRLVSRWKIIFNRQPA
jgi:anti-sigma factor ChrR (cupin superfamily)